MQRAPVREGNVPPRVLYGGGSRVHFVAPMILFRELSQYTNAHFVPSILKAEVTGYPSGKSNSIRKVKSSCTRTFFRSAKENQDGYPHSYSQAAGCPKEDAGAQAASLMVFPKRYAGAYRCGRYFDFHHAIKVMDMKMPNLEFFDPKRASIAVVEFLVQPKMAEEEAACGRCRPAEGEAQLRRRRRGRGTKRMPARSKHSFKNPVPARSERDFYYF